MVEAPGGASTLTQEPNCESSAPALALKLYLVRIVGPRRFCRYGVGTPFAVMKRSTNSLIGQVAAVNGLLVVATLSPASAAASVNLSTQAQLTQFRLLALTIVLSLVINMMMI